MQMRPIYPLLLAHLMTASVCAGFFSSNSNNLVAAQETSTNPTPSRSSPSQERIPPVSISDSVHCGWTADASFLYWNASADGYEFAQHVHQNTTMNGRTPTLSEATVSSEAIPFDSWDPGFQLGLGYIFPQREQWAVRLGWTHLDTSSHHFVELTSFQNQTLRVSLLPVIMGPLASSAEGNWHLHYNMLDADIGRRFFVGKYLSIKPLFGLRGGWIHQNFKVNYAGLFRTSVATFPLDTSFHYTQDLHAIGMRMGSELKYYMGEQWSLLGMFSSSLVHASSSSNQKLRGYLFFDNSTFFPVKADEPYSFNKLRTNLEGQLGVQWETFYHHDRFRFAISALYTFSYWFRISNLINEVVTDIDDPVLTRHVQASVGNGDLQLQGLNLQFNFDF